MKFSLRLNNDLSVREARRIARAAERAGFDQIWISNDLFLRSAPVLLAAMALETRRLGIGSGILNPYTMHAAEIAMAAATLDELSEGRFHLGVAAGASEFLEWVGIEQRAPLSKMRGVLQQLRGLLDEHHEPVGRDAQREEEASSAPGDWTTEAYLRFPPAARSGRSIPIYLGASGPRMQVLAGELADGVLPLLFPPERFGEVRRRVEKGRALDTRVEREFDFAACFWVSVAASSSAARHPLAEKIAYYGPAMGERLLAPLGLVDADFVPIRRALAERRPLPGVAELVDERMLRLGVAGTPDEIVKRLEPLCSEGARHLSFGPPLGPDPLAAIELLGRRVLPALRGEDSGR